MSKAIEIKGLKKTYADGTEALKGIDFEVEEGDFCALLGANGAGKTTVIGVMTSLVNKTAGQVKIFGVDVERDFPKAKKFMGVVPQEINFNFFERAWDIVINQAGFYGIDRRAAAHEAERLFKALELWNKRDAPSRHLSGGMKRRLMVARALINRPKLLILDEPTAGVDVELRHLMWKFLNELNRSGTTILLTTHYLEEVEQMCRHAAMIKDGKIIAYDKVKRLVKLLENETYTVHVENHLPLDGLKKYNIRVIDEVTFDIDIGRAIKLNDFMMDIGRMGITITDLRPKANRMERLFLELLKK